MSQSIDKDKHIENYIKTLAAIENEMEPYKESKRELKVSYVESGKLTKEEISMAVKAYRLIKGEVDFEQLRDFYEQVSKTVGRG